ncbi:MAG: TlpA disulfide reductase family protein [Actinomycetota bacterium]|nr:TlpA disulfide reductase family protein [Actinomycetota bacterium]
MNEASPTTEVTGPRGGNPTRKAAIAVGIALVALIALLAFGGGFGATITDEADESPLLGRRVPAIAGTSLQGEPFDIDQLRGQWTLVNFFAAWCPPCIAEHPELVELEAWGAGNGRLSLVSIVFDDEPANVAELFDELGGSWPVLNAPGSVVDFQIRRVPESFLVNPDGVVVARAISGIDAEVIIEQIEGAS